MNSFKHIISTRFNVPTKNWNTTREGKSVLSEEWLKDRFNLFLNYTLPSFKNQTCQDFYWLVFFDIHTPNKYRDIIENIKEEFPKFTPLFVEDFSQMKSKLINTCLNIIKDTPYIVTTDIDNDDMLHKDFVGTVQAHFYPTHDLVIDMRRGIQLTYLPPNKSNAFDYYHVSNAFVSIVEDSTNFQTVIKDKHLSYRNYQHYKFYDKTPMFIQLIHSNNLVNNVYNNSKQLLSIQQKDFGISKEKEFNISVLDALVYNIKKNVRTLKKILFTQ